MPSYGAAMPAKPLRRRKRIGSSKVAATLARRMPSSSLTTARLPWRWRGSAARAAPDCGPAGRPWCRRVPLAGIRASATPSGRAAGWFRNRDRCRTVEQAAKLYHMGFREPVARSTLADANELRDLKGSIPNFIHVSDGKLHDVHAIDLLELEAGARQRVHRRGADQNSAMRHSAHAARRTGARA